MGRVRATGPLRSGRGRRSRAPRTHPLRHGTRRHTGGGRRRLQPRKLALDVTMRPRGPLTLGKVLEPSSIESATATRLLTALGMTTDLNEPITAGEGETIQLFVASLGLLGEEAAVQLARVTGSAMAKVAETLVGGFRIQVELPRLESGVRYIDVVKEYSDIIHSLLPAFRPQSRCAAATADPGRGQADVVNRRGAFNRDPVAYRRIRRPGRVHRSDRFPHGSGVGGRAHRLRRAHRTSRAAGERASGRR